MNATGNETLGRIQQEIKETLEREEELRKEYAKITNNDPISRNENGVIKHTNEDSLQNGLRRFMPNPSTRGVMQKFLKMRGKVSMTNLKTSNNNPYTAWPAPEFEPAKITVEAGKSIRNGFVPAEEKMRRELKEFQRREEELRQERRKSQPDLMAALNSEESNLKPARSMALLYSTEDLSDFNSNSAPPSLKPAKSLAELCDASDDDLESPGTHSLIMQFENLKQGRV